MGEGEYVINAASAIVAMEYMGYGFQKKYSGIRHWIYFIVGCVVYFFTVTTLNLVIEYEGVTDLLPGFILVVYAFLALEGRTQDFLKAGLLWVVITMVSTYCSFDMVALVVKFSMGKIVMILWRKQEDFPKREKWIVAGTFMVMALLAMGVFWLEAGELGPSERYWLTIGILADEMAIAVFVAELYHQLGKYHQDEKGHLDMYRIGREINHWRHDMSGVLGVLYRMQKSGRYGEVEAYMEKLYIDLKNYPELLQPTGNEGLDAALMKTIPKCSEKDIHFCYVVLGKPWQIDSIELGRLIDNLLSNGMEACFRVIGEKELELRVRALKGGLEIYLENSIEESVVEHNPKLVSHKKEKERHGFGMESIYRIVKEYEGIYEYWEEEKRFCQCIYLNYK